ncbi:3' exoribonuclease family, domain 1-domain-containing protein [Lipomyces oligophaga]|uniref:3' exoribonuclease family, domain 1-domain-containing protein n=1 Tax=Lipomyces oligophaga TaxID=45792 RepID=UPI0034CFDA2E
MFLPDRRRILVPPSASALRFIDPDGISTEDSRPAPNKAHEFFLKASIASSSSPGSAYIEHGQQKILAFVEGPRPIRSSFSNKARFEVDVRFLPVSSDLHTLGIQRGQGFYSALERNISEYVYTSIVPSIRLDQYPKSLISLSIVILSNHTSKADQTKQIAASCVTTASIALVDSGIQLMDIVTACAVKFTINPIKVELDLDDDETNIGKGVVSLMISRDEITGFWIDNDSQQSLDDVYLLESLFETAQNGAKELRKLINSVLLDSVPNSDSQI